MDLLDEVLGLRDLSRPELLDRLGLGAGAVDEGRRYEGLEGLDMAHDPDVHPARFYFRGDELVMIYLSGPELSLDELRAHVSGAGVSLRSRQAKPANLEVHPGDGIAFSELDDEIGFVEVFPPTTEQAYRDRIYREPGPFRK
ncbi:hypothetical protein BH20ACT2_BH20ACT2_03740 [soil metagenome]